jgi:hypothetical protein
MPNVVHGTNASEVINAADGVTNGIDLISATAAMTRSSVSAATTISSAAPAPTRSTADRAPIRRATSLPPPASLRAWRRERGSAATRKATPDRHRESRRQFVRGCAHRRRRQQLAVRTEWRRPPRGPRRRRHAVGWSGQRHAQRRGRRRCPHRRPGDRYGLLL